MQGGKRGCAYVFCKLWLPCNLGEKMADLGHEMCQLLPAVGMFLLVLCLRGPWSPVPAVSLPWLSPFLCVLCSED